MITGMCLCSCYFCQKCIYLHVHVKPTIPVLKAGHSGVLVIVCLRVCTVRVWCIGSGFSFFSSSTTNLASVLYIHVCLLFVSSHMQVNMYLR